MFFSGSLNKLYETLRQLPGIGPKSAKRLAVYLVSKDKNYSMSLSSLISETVNSYRNCSKCNMLCQSEICTICEDKNRQSENLCIVERSEDVSLIEETGEFNGYYFVLGALLSPLDKLGLREINFSKLKKLLSNRDVKEIVLAINLSTEGEMTMSFLAEELSSYNITRLAMGLPFGGDLHYSTSITIANALRRRIAFKNFYLQINISIK